MRSISKSAMRIALLATVTGVTGTLIPTTGFAQTTPVAPASEVAATDQPKAEDIIILGTRRTDRTLTNSASPIDVISAAELQTQPTANLLDSLKNIVPSFFVGQNTISDASSFVRSPSLRGLPGDEVLVMLDGKRYNRSALVQVYSGGDTGLSYGSQGSDISAIPEIAIKNLQILRDGAASQYGSDAIAGVLNFGLRDNKTGLEVIGKYGQYYDHGDGKSKQISANLGVALGERGFVNLSGEYDDDGQTSRGATRPIALIFAAQNPSLASQIPNYPGPAQIWGSSPTHGYKLLLNSAYDVTDNSKLYLFVNVAHSHTNESFNYRSPISGTAVDQAGVTHTLSANGAFNPIYLTPCPTGNVTCPAGGFVKDSNTFNLTSLYPAGFTPRFIGVTDEAYGTLGYKGKSDGGLSYDLSGSLSRNSLDLSMYDSISPSYGPASQTSFKFGNLIQKEVDGNLDLSYPVPISAFASPLTVSGGAEYRKETYTQTAGDPQSYGAGPYTSQALYSLVSPGVYTAAGTAGQSPAASGYGGTSPAAAGTWSQNDVAGYIDLETDITKALSVGIAGRYEHYNTFGDAKVGKINAIYKVSDFLSIRGTVGTGFHAPSPGQSHDEILTTNFVNGNQVQTGTYPVSSPIAQYYGAKPLTPEKSTNFGVGVILKPAPAFTLTVDGYSIKVKNRIFITENYNVTAADVAAQPALLSVGVGGVVNFFTNGLNTLTQGVDVVGTYHTRLNDGSNLNFTLAYNYNHSKVSSFNANVISEAQIIDVEHLAPNHRLVFTTNYIRGSFSLSARENFYGSWQDAVDYPGQVFGSKFTTDLDLSYTINKTFTLTVGASNLFNTYPNKIAQTSTNAVYPVTGSLSDGEVYPRSGGPFGINGGQWFARLKVDY